MKNNYVALTNCVGGKIDLVETCDSRSGTVVYKQPQLGNLPLFTYYTIMLCMHVHPCRCCV